MNGMGASALCEEPLMLRSTRAVFWAPGLSACFGPSLCTNGGQTETDEGLTGYVPCERPVGGAQATFICCGSVLASFLDMLGHTGRPPSSVCFS
jgi:hypothetical protein